MQVLKKGKERTEELTQKLKSMAGYAVFQFRMCGITADLDLLSIVRSSMAANFSMDGQAMVKDEQFRMEDEEGASTAFFLDIGQVPASKMICLSLS